MSALHRTFKVTQLDCGGSGVRAGVHWLAAMGPAPHRLEGLAAPSLLAALDGGTWVLHLGGAGALSLCMHLWNILQQGTLERRAVLP